MERYDTWSANSIQPLVRQLVPYLVNLSTTRLVNCHKQATFTSMKNETIRYVACKHNTQGTRFYITIRGVHSGYWVSFGRVPFDLVLFRIGYISDACCHGSYSGRVGSISYGSVEDRLFELSG